MVGVVAGVSLIGFAIFFFMQKRRRKQRATAEVQEAQNNTTFKEPPQDQILPSYEVKELHGQDRAQELESIASPVSAELPGSTKQPAELPASNGPKI